MLASLASLRVSKSNVEAISGGGTYESRFGPIVIAKIRALTIATAYTAVIKVIRPPGSWNRQIEALDVRTSDNTL